MADTGDRNDPYGAYNFLVELDGVTVAGFSEASGLTSESDVVEYRTGAEDTTVRKLPGLKKFSNLTLKRGFTASDELWKWRLEVLNGATVRHSGTIVLLNEARQAAIKWTFREAWPSKWEGPTFNAKTSEMAIETLELACEGVELELAG
ncbi:MAG TPA: phage tail protein [Longimicrobiaceae bacterium]|jgi:phage tail-like protein|nr:phage tail protein [Longimicrobiaceae bacterium]